MIYLIIVLVEEFFGEFASGDLRFDCVCPQQDLPTSRFLVFHILHARNMIAHMIDHDRK